MIMQEGNHSQSSMHSQSLMRNQSSLTASGLKAHSSSRKCGLGVQCIMTTVCRKCSRKCRKCRYGTTVVNEALFELSFESNITFSTPSAHLQCWAYMAQCTMRSKSKVNKKCYVHTHTPDTLSSHVPDTQKTAVYILCYRAPSPCIIYMYIEIIPAKHPNSYIRNWIWIWLWV